MISHFDRKGLLQKDNCDSTLHRKVPMQRCMLMGVFPHTTHQRKLQLGRHTRINSNWAMGQLLPKVNCLPFNQVVPMGPHTTHQRKLQLGRHTRINSNWAMGQLLPKVNCLPFNQVVPMGPKSGTRKEEEEVES
ncbi:hypothetical protein VNO77_19258 [Canavalia gladiata]|uniref:Uncharacterized protein n=1 Tax=Canavalia gladiata TaxID=3824 RepID=A0AAN9LN12_CANGL